jgi:hypothetical protein
VPEVAAWVWVAAQPEESLFTAPFAKRKFWLASRSFPTAAAARSKQRPVLSSPMTSDGRILSFDRTAAVLYAELFAASKPDDRRRTRVRAHS